MGSFSAPQRTSSSTSTTSWNLTYLFVTASRLSILTEANVQGAPDLAISDLSFAIQLDPQKALPLLLERARLQETLNRHEQALADYQRVLEITPANEEAKAAITRFKSQALKTD